MRVHCRVQIKSRYLSYAYKLLNHGLFEFTLTGIYRWNKETITRKRRQTVEKRRERKRAKVNDRDRQGWNVKKKHVNEILQIMSVQLTVSLLEPKHKLICTLLESGKFDSFNKKRRRTLILTVMVIYSQEK